MTLTEYLLTEQSLAGHKRRGESEKRMQREKDKKEI